MRRDSHASVLQQVPQLKRLHLFDTKTLISARRMLQVWTLGGRLLRMCRDCKMLLHAKNAYLVATNDEQRWIRRVESARVKLVPVAVEFLNAVLAGRIQRPYFHCVFTGGGKIFTRGAPTHWINMSGVALQKYPKKRVMLEWSLPINSQIWNDY
jgi:hypothetical protein